MLILNTEGTNKLLGRYEVLETIGRGATSTVLKARDTLIGRIVALKTFQAGLGGSNCHERFLAEARIVGQLCHPRIVSLYDVGIEESSGMPFLVMEYVSGQPLDRLLAAGKSEPQQAYTWGAALARALAYAHRRGVIHQDVKPANILVDEDGCVKLTDFGIARWAAHTSHSGELRGTPAYLSPEQIEGRSADCRSDLFSLGIVIYELAARRRPFPADSLAAVCAQILKAPLTLPSQVNPTLPPALDDVLSRCLTKNAADRYATGEELATDLEGIPRETPASALKHGAPISSTQDSSTSITAVLVRHPHHECRRRSRSKLALPVRVRPSDPEKDEHFEEVLKTLNASRDGLYFETRCESYYERMRLFVTFPFSSSDLSISSEYIGHVVRMDRLGGGRLGVAVRLLGTMNLAPPSTAVRMQRK